MASGEVINEDIETISPSESLVTEQKQQVPDSDDNSDDDFDDFDDFQLVPQTVANVTNTSSTSSNQKSTSQDVQFASFSDSLFADNFSLLLLSLFPDQLVSRENSTVDNLLTDRSKHMYHQLSLRPHLRPPSWTRLKIRRHLLIQLGVPVNLDEVLPASTGREEQQTLKPPGNSRRKLLVSEYLINWDQFTIPKVDDLKLSPEQFTERLQQTTHRLSIIETAILEHTSEQFLKGKSEEEINEKYRHLLQQRNELLELGSIWVDHLDKLKKDYEVYESVVQNLVGHTQRLKRDELIANLGKVKIKSHNPRHR